MADIFSQYIGYGGELEQAKAGFGRTLSSIGASMMGEIIQRKESEEYSNAITKWIEQTDEYYQWQRDNADKPEEFEAELDRRRESMQAAMLQDVTTPGAKADIINRFTTDFARLKESANEKAAQQSRANQQFVFDINYNKLTEPPKFAWTKDDAQQKVDSVIELIKENYGKVPELMTQEQADYLEDTAFQQNIGYYALQTAEIEDDLSVDKLNAMAQEEFGLDEKIFDVEEAARLRADYESQRNAETRIAENELKEKQENNYKQFLSKIWDSELTDIGIVRQAYLSGEIDEQQKDKLVKAIGGAGDEDDPFLKTANPAKKAEIFQKAARDQITHDQIDTEVGKTISIADGEQAHRILDDTAHPLKTPLGQYYTQKLDEMREKVDVSDYISMNDQLVRALTQEPQPSADQMEKIWDMITESATKNWLLKTFENYMDFYPGIWWLSSKYGPIDRLKGRFSNGEKIAEPKTQAEYDALPSGIPYRRSDGSVWIK